MKSMVLFLLVAALTGCKTTPVTSVPTSESFVESVNYSEVMGKKLYDEISSGNSTEEHTSREKDLIDMGRNLLCGGEYRAVSIYDNLNIENIYILSIPPSSEGIQFGRHLKFRFREGSNNIIDVAPSTKTCIVVPTGDGGMPYITHLMSETPSEYHVFLSLYHKVNIYVGTSSGTWKVEAGKVSKVS